MSAKKILYILGLNKKKNNFIYFAGGETPSQGEAATPAPEGPKVDPEIQGQKDRHEAGEEAAADNTDVIDPIDEALKELDQTKFDKFLENITKLDRAMSTEQVDKLVDFAETSKEGKNYDKIFSAIDKSNITAEKISQNSMDKMIAFYYNSSNAEKIQSLINKFTSYPSSTSKLINTAKDDLRFLKDIFNIIKTNTELFQKIETSALIILTNQIGIEKILLPTSDNQRAEILTNPETKTKNKIKLYEITMEICDKKIAELDSTLRTAIVNYAFKENNEEYIKNIRPQLDEATIAKLEPKEAPKTEDEPKTETATETLSNNLNSNQLLQAAGIEMIRRGKKIGWSFEIKTDDGKTIQSERNFLNTKKFRNQLTAKDENGNLINNTPDKVKLFCYQYLLRIITDDGSIDDNKWNVVEAEKSNQILKSEIARLSGNTETPAPEAAPAVEAAPAPEAGPDLPPPAYPTPAPEAAPAPEARPDLPPPAYPTPAPEAAPEPEAGPDLPPPAGPTPLTAAETAADKVAEETAPVESFETSIHELQNEGFKAKIEASKPDKLNKTQFKALKKALSDIKVAVAEGKDAITIMSQLDNIAKNTAPILKNSSIGKITILSTPVLKWNAQKLNKPFGDEFMLIDQITRIKEKQLGTSSEEYQEFKDLTTTKGRNFEDKVQLIANLDEYKRNYKNLVEKVYEVHLNGISEENMVKNWKNFNGYKNVESIMTMPPFLLHTENVRTVASAIITEGSNEKVEFEDIFKFMKGFPQMQGKVAANLLRNSDDFLAEFNRLIKAQESGKISQNESTTLENMSTEILLPCIRLLKALSQLKPLEKARTPKSEKLQKAPSEEQAKILKAFSKLCSFDQKKSGSWENFIVKISGGKDKITMSDINGETFTVDKGKFKNHYSTKGALSIMENTPEFYEITDEGKSFDTKKVLDGINEMIMLGFVNIVMEREGQKRNDSKSMAETLKSQEFKTEMSEYIVSDLGQITEKQIKAFQTGFILKQSQKFAEQIQEARNALTENDETMQNHPLFRQIASQLLEKGVSPEKIKKIKEKLLFAGGVSFKNGKFEGAGLGVPFEIGDGLTVVIGLGATTNGDVIAGAALDIKVYRGNKVEASVVFTMGIQGVSAGARATLSTEYVNLHGFAGGAWSWDKIIPTSLGSFGISWNMDAQLKRDIKEAEGNTNYAAAWNEWKNIPTNNIEAKYEAAKKIPQIWAKVGPLQETFSLTNADVVHMLEGIKDQMTSKVLNNLESPIPLFAYVGFGIMAPAIPIPHVAFKLGSATISIPNRTAISAELSNSIINKKLKIALEKLDKGEEKISVFHEQTGSIVYSRDGKLLKLESSEEIDLKDWETTPESYNDALKKAEIKLTKNANGTMEITDLNPNRKDVEIHIDPTLRDLALISDSGKVLIEGNIDDLIITRKRYSLPFEIAEDTASMRDSITIKQRSSIRGQRDDAWIQNHEKGFFQKLESEESFSLYGENQGNIKKINGYSKVEDPTKLNSDIASLIAKRPKLSGKLDKKTIQELKEKISARRKAMKALDSKKYENQEIRENLFPNLDNLMDTNNEFKTKFESLIEEPEKIAALVSEYGETTETLKGIGKNGHEKELNFAVIHLLNRWFTNVFRESSKKGADEKLSKKEIRALNKKVLKGMEKKIEYVKKHVFLPEFEKTIASMDPKPSMSAKEITEKLINDVYKGILTYLKNPNADFRKLTVEAIPEGAQLISGSRLYEKGERKGALAETTNYSTMPKAEALLHDFGFLEGTTGRYKLDSTNPKEKEMARVLLEMASPIPKDDIEFLKSPLAQKIAGLKSHALLCYTKETGFDDYDKISELYTDPTILQNSEAHKEALNRFKDLVKEIRKSQIDGTTFERQIGETGLTVRINLETNIVHGAYSKCTNLSFYTEETGKIEIIKKVKNEQKIVAVFNNMTDVVNTDMSKIFASFGVGVGFRDERIKPNAGPGGKTGGGTGGESNNGAGQEVTTPQGSDQNANAGE